MEKTRLVIYWVATALFSFGMSFSGIGQVLRTKAMIDIFDHLGYPIYLMTILGIWKILGVVVILIPGFRLVKEWAYAGFFFTMTGALVSHLACGDHDAKSLLGPLMQTIFIVLSWYFRPLSRRLVSKA